MYGDMLGMMLKMTFRSYGRTDMNGESFNQPDGITSIACQDMCQCNARELRAWSDPIRILLEYSEMWVDLPTVCAAPLLGHVGDATAERQ